MNLSCGVYGSYNIGSGINDRRMIDRRLTFTRTAGLINRLNLGSSKRAIIDAGLVNDAVQLAIPKCFAAAAEKDRPGSIIQREGSRLFILQRTVDIKSQTVAVVRSGDVIELPGHDVGLGDGFG